MKLCATNARITLPYFADELYNHFLGQQLFAERIPVLIISLLAFTVWHQIFFLLEC